VTLTPEIKEFGSDIDEMELAQYVQTIRDHGLLGRTETQSFVPAVFARLRALQVAGEPPMRLVYLSGTVVSAATVTSAGADIASIQMSALKRTNVDVYHQQGMPVYAWTALNDGGLKAAWDLHVDSVITDVPSAALRLYR
jgi:glycerophosphoryl diester phosphodiesterase